MQIRHAVNIYDHPNQAEQMRLKRAASTWEPAKPYNSNPLQETFSLRIPNDMLPRLSNVVFGDTRSLPFVKDLIQVALEFGIRQKVRPENPIIVVTNADTCICTDTWNVISAEFWGSDNKIAYSHRRNFTRWPKRRLSVRDIEIRGEPFVGIDLVAFDSVWWQKNKNAFPDMVLGCEGWDWIFKFWQGSVKLRDCVYHEYHYPPYWMSNRTCPGELWNKRLAVEWVAKQPNAERIEMDWPTLEQYRLEILSVKN